MKRVKGLQEGLTLAAYIRMYCANKDIDMSFFKPETAIYSHSIYVDLRGRGLSFDSEGILHIFEDSKDGSFAGIEIYYKDGVRADFTVCGESQVIDIRRENGDL